MKNIKGEFAPYFRGFLALFALSNCQKREIKKSAGETEIRIPRPMVIRIIQCVCFLPCAYHRPLPRLQQPICRVKTDFYSSVGNTQSSMSLRGKLTQGWIHPNLTSPSRLPSASAGM